MDNREQIKWEDIPEHKNAEAYRSQLPEVGTIIDGLTVMKAKVASAFWLTKNAIMPGKPLDPRIAFRSAECVPTVLLMVEFDADAP